MIFFFLVIPSLFVDFLLKKYFNDLQYVPSLFSIRYISQIRNFDTSQFMLPSHPKSFKNCKICDFHPNNGKSIPNSSERDVILTIGCRKLTNLLIFVKTLRTTGCKCRFVVFADNSAMHRYKPNFYKAVENCGVEFVNFIGLKKPVDIACVRFRIYFDFLIRNQVLFNRVYICDLFDTIVQHDPFTTEFGDMLYLSDEGVKISADSINQYWISKDIDDMMSKSNDTDFVFSEDFKKNITNFNILNSGLIAGSIDNMIQYCLAMSRLENEKTFDLFAVYDQGFHNIIVYSGFLNGKANYTIAETNSEMFSTIGIYITRTNNIERNEAKMEFGAIQRDGKIPGILHQFDRSAKIKNMLIKSCPNDENFEDYMRDLKM